MDAKDKILSLTPEALENMGYSFNIVIWVSLLCIHSTLTNCLKCARHWTRDQGDRHVSMQSLFYRIDTILRGNSPVGKRLQKSVKCYNRGIHAIKYVGLSGKMKKYLSFKILAKSWKLKWNLPSEPKLKKAEGETGFLESEYSRCKGTIPNGREKKMKRTINVGN